MQSAPSDWEIPRSLEPFLFPPTHDLPTPGSSAWPLIRGGQEGKAPGLQLEFFPLLSVWYLATQPFFLFAFCNGSCLPYFPASVQKLMDLNGLETLLGKEESDQVVANRNSGISIWWDTNKSTHHSPLTEPHWLPTTYKKMRCGSFSILVKIFTICSQLAFPFPIPP